MQRLADFMIGTLILITHLIFMALEESRAQRRL
jgi:hypothetical protein